MKCQTPFSLGPGSASTTSKKNTKMQARRSSDCKNEATLKKGGKKQGHLQSDRSKAYTKGKVSVHPGAAIATENCLSPALGTFLPLSQVNQKMLDLKAEYSYESSSGVKVSILVPVYSS